jgi:hypothetical protein
MSIPQFEGVLSMTDQASRKLLQAKKQPPYFMYDYSFDPEVFKRLYPSAKLVGLAHMPDWEWFLDLQGM